MAFLSLHAIDFSKVTTDLAAQFLLFAMGTVQIHPIVGFENLTDHI